MFWKKHDFFDENQMLSQSAQKVRPILTDRQNSLNQFLAIGIDLKIQQHFQTKNSKVLRKVNIFHSTPSLKTWFS